MKLELEPQERIEELRSIISLLDGVDNLDSSKLAEAFRGIPQYPPKNAVEIVASFLTNIREYAIEQLDHDSARNKDVRATVPIDLVITVPAGWSNAGKSRIFQAVTHAGFTDRYFPTLDKIAMVSEPEAAAEYTLRSVHQDPSFEVHRVRQVFSVHYITNNNRTIHLSCATQVEVQ